MNTVAIGDSNLKIADGNYSAKYPRSEEFISEGIPFIRGNNFENKSISDKNMYFISPEKHSELKKGHVKPKDVLITTRGNIGKVALVPERHDDSNINSQLVLLRCNEGWHPEYLLHTFNSKFVTRQIPALITGSALKQLSVKNLKKLKIPLPPLDQQKKIAAILDAADAYRQKTKALIEKYDELTQSLFLDMFGDETGSLTELGKVIKTVGGGTPSKDNEQYWNGSIPWASVKDLKSDRLNKTQDFITQAGVDNSATRVIPNGSLIVATRMAVGRAAICEMDVAINQDLKAIQLIGEINITYLLYLFKSKENYFDSVSSGATVKGIKIEHITKLKVNLPEIDLQNQFAERVQAIEAQKAQAQASLAGAEDLFNSLLQRAFKGELTS